MKTTKRVISTILVVVMCLTMAPLNGFMEIKWEGFDFPEFDFSEIFTPKAKAATSGYYTYSVTDGKATITDVDSSISGDIIIPSTLGGYPVTSIGSSAFYYCSALTSVSIPDSVTSIGDSAFANCYALTSVTIPDSVTSIGYGAFRYCDALTSVTIPDSVTSIGYYAFYGCKALTSIIVDENNSNYSSDANGVLFNKNRTTLIQYPAGSNKTTYTIPDSVTSIRYEAFDGCKALTSVTIPDSVTSIGDSAFRECKALTSVTIPDSVTSIGYYAFYGCKALTSIIVDENNSNYSSDADGLLFNKNRTTLIQYPAGSNKTAYTIPDSVTSIGYYAFEDCDALTSVTIGNSVTSIGDYAFRYCSALTSVTIGNSVTSIGYSAFYGCSALTSVSIPDSVTFIGDSAFYNCSALTSVTIPDSVIFIGWHAFYGCDKLTDVYYSGTQEQWQKISIDTENDPLLNATIHYNAYHIHSYNSEVTTTATHLKEGVMTYTCSCGDTYTEVIAKTTEHNYNAVVTPPTCEDKGYTTYTCECGDSYAEDIPKLGHNFSKEFTVDKEATYTESGLKSKHCLREGCAEVSEVTVIPKLVAEFTDSDMAVLAGNAIGMVPGLTVEQLLSLATEGSVVKKENGDVAESSEVPATGMVLELPDGTEHTVVVLGDVDGDGGISAADARLALRASVGLEKYSEDLCYYKAANVEGKDNLSSSDARLILRASVGLEDPKAWLK